MNKFSSLSTQTSLHGSLLIVIGGMVTSIPPPELGPQSKFPTYPSILTIVAGEGTGAPRITLLSVGQNNKMAYTETSSPAICDVYLN